MAGTTASAPIPSQQWVRLTASCCYMKYRSERMLPISTRPKKYGVLPHIKTHKMLTYTNNFQAGSISLSSPQYRFTTQCARGQGKGAAAAAGRTPAGNKAKASACPLLYTALGFQSLQQLQIFGALLRLQTAHAFPQFTPGARQRDFCARLDIL